MDYSTFKTFVTTYLWHTNDTMLSNNLDNLILMANAEIDTLTHDWERRQESINLTPQSSDISITGTVSDFGSVRSLVNNDTSAKQPLMQKVTPAEVYTQRALDATQLYPIYAVDYDHTDGNIYMRFAAPFSASNVGDLQMHYRVKVPDFAVTDTSWVADEYLNMYVYAVCKHCALFLREDERVATYAEMLQDAFTKAEEQDKHSFRLGGAPMQMQPHRQVP